jgi:hypothetical protein
MGIREWLFPARRESTSPRYSAQENISDGGISCNFRLRYGRRHPHGGESGFSC